MNLEQIKSIVRTCEMQLREAKMMKFEKDLIKYYKTNLDYWKNEEKNYSGATRPEG